MNSKRLWIGGVILLVLVLVRLWLIWALGHTLYAEYPQVDAFTYWQQADGLWQGKDPFKEGLYQPPAYPYFIYAVSLISLMVQVLRSCDGFNLDLAC